MVLHLYSVTNVNKLPVFEDEEIVLFRETLETLDGFFAKVRHDVTMSLEYGNVWAKRCNGKSRVQKTSLSAHTPSAVFKRSAVVVRSADRAMLDFFVSATVNSFLSNSLDAALARAEYVCVDLDAISNFKSVGDVKTEPQESALEKFRAFGLGLLPFSATFCCPTFLVTSSPQTPGKVGQRQLTHKVSACRSKTESHYSDVWGLREITLARGCTPLML